MVKPLAIAAIQARLDSSRLPGKVLAPVVNDVSLLEVLVTRVRTEGLDLWLLTTERRLDDPLAELGGDMGLSVFRGAERDVLSRFANVCTMSRAVWCIRMTADNPFVDGKILNHLVEQASLAPSSVAWIGDLDREYPLGYVPEIVRCSALVKLDRELSPDEEAHREHVTSAIPSGARVPLQGFDQPRRPDWRWTIDEDADLEMARKAFSSLGGCWASADYTALVECLDNRAAITSLNEHVAQKGPVLDTLRDA